MPSPQTCLYCGSDSSEKLYPMTDVFGDRWDLRLCQNCGAHFIDPMPTGEQLARAYDESYYGEGEEKFEGPVEKVLNKFRDMRASHVAKLCKRQGRVLDIGCGNGNFLAALGKRGDFELHGLELAGGSAERAKRVPGLNLHIGTLEDDTYPENHFDAIVLFHVFEHLPNPAEILDRMVRLLKPGGHLVMSFPNIGSFQADHFGSDWLHLDPPRHLFFFAPGPFKKIMAERGFSVVRERHFQPEYNPFGFQQSILNRWVGEREVLYEMLKGNTAYIAKYPKWKLTAMKLFFMATFPLFIVIDAVEAAFKKGGTVEFTLKKTS